MTIGSNTQRQEHALDKNIESLEASVTNKPAEPKFHAALGILLMRRNDQEQSDQSRAVEYFTKTIEIAPDTKHAAWAHANRGRIYRIQELYDKAQTDLLKANELSDKLTPLQQEKLNEDINLLEQAFRQQKIHSTFSQPTLPHSRENIMVPDKNFCNLVASDHRLKNVDPASVMFFGQLLLFLNKKMDSEIHAAPHKGSEVYWKAFALCTKALSQEREYGMITSPIHRLYFDAKETFEQLLHQYRDKKKSPPSMIRYVTATVYFKLGSTNSDLEQEYFKKSLEQLDLAIEANPDGDVNYYRFRALLHEQMGNKEPAEADEQKALEIDPNPPYYRMVLSAYNEISHCIDFYDEAKLDNTNHYLPDTLCDSVADFGIHLAPKRGDELDPLEILYAKRAMLCAVLGRTDPEKLDQSIEDAGTALGKLPKEHPLYPQVLHRRAQVHYYMNNFSKALEDLEEAESLNPSNMQEIEEMKQNVLSALETKQNGEQ